MNVRNIYGRIVSIITVPPRHGEQIVPSLGSCVDSFLDSFGYPVDFVVALNDARVAAKSKTHFVSTMSRYMPRTEAGWIWDNSVVSAKPTICVRTYDTP
jgi:hypothetical protein